MSEPKRPSTPPSPQSDAPNSSPPHSSPPSLTPSLSPTRHKRSLRNYLIEPKFQIKYTAILVGITLSVAVVLVGFLGKTSSAVLAESAQSVEESTRAIGESKKLSDVVRLSIVRDYGDNPELLAQYMKGADATDQQLEAQARAIRVQAAVIEAQQRSMMTSLVGGLAVMVFLIGLLGIYVTHKVAGPIYKIRNLLRRVAQGKLIFPGRLRRGDELQDFFDDFTKMVDALRERQAKEVGDLATAMKLAREGGASPESIAKIETVHDEMKRALDV